LLSGVGLFTEILERAPKVKLLVTSRERLNLHGEWVVEIQGLPVPPAGEVEHLDDYSAAALFVQSARRAQAAFELKAEERSAMVSICRMVEGMPLGIELAAAWVSVLSCREIAGEIERNLDFLATTLRDAPARHRSLRAAFEHSWKLLSPVERETLSRLSIFRGGFAREAAEQVAGATLPTLSMLVSKSLVRRAESGRYDLHEVIRQYASVHPPQDDSQYLETRDRHSAYYLDLASDYERKLKSAAQQEAMRDMTVELDNIRTAWDWGIRRGNFESMGQAVRAFGWYYEVAGLIHDGIEQLELLVQALRGAPRDPRLNRVLGSSLVQQGLLCFRSGRFVQAQELYRDAIAILRSVNEQALLADALILSGVLIYLNGDYLEARELIEEGLSYAQAANDPWFAAYGIYNLGNIDSLMGEYQKGYDQMQAGLKLWRELGDPHSISLGLNFLVDTQIALGRHEEAIASMRESIALCERTQNRWGMGTAYRYLGLAHLAAGQYAEARGCLQKSLEAFGDYFKGWDIARTLIYLGEAHSMAGERPEARTTLLEALRLAHDIHSSPLTLDALLGLADLDAQAGDVEKAWQLADCVARHAASTAEARARAARLCAETEARLTPEQFEALQSRASAAPFQSVAQQILDGA
jgi:tetratricopeptide (TPR) repeat protein